MPTALRGPIPLVASVAFMVPDDWAPQQALAVFELQKDLQAVVIGPYGAQRHDLLREQRQPVVAARHASKWPPF